MRSPNNSSRWRCAGLTAIGLLILVSTGCQRGNGLQEVSGNVSFDGEPLERGSIEFIRDGKPPQPAGGAMIRSGGYSLPRAHGLAPGRYKVLISSPDLSAVPQVETMEAYKPPNRERIPAAFNSESVQFVEIHSDAVNRFDFRIDP